MRKAEPPLTGPTNRKLASDVRYRLLFKEAVVIRQNAAEVLGLNSVGARILAMIDEGASETEMIERLAEEFDVAPAVLEEDVPAFVQELMEIGVVDPTKDRA